MPDSPFIIVPEPPQDGAAAEPAPMRRLEAWGEPQPETAEPQGPEFMVVPYFGTDIRVIADPLSMSFVLEEFLDMAAQLEGTEDMRAVGAVRAFLRALVAPQDWNQFWGLVKTNRQDLEKQMAFGKWLVESLAAHPTDAPSASSPGRAITPLRSEGDASSRAKARLEEAGRPDLAEAVLLRREFRAASTG